MLGTADRKTVHAEVTDHFRYAVERFAELAQDVRVQLLVLLYSHVHETASASGKSKREFVYGAPGLPSWNEVKLCKVFWQEKCARRTLKVC